MFGGEGSAGEGGDREACEAGECAVGKASARAAQEPVAAQPPVLAGRWRVPLDGVVTCRPAGTEALDRKPVREGEEAERHTLSLRSVGQRRGDGDDSGGATGVCRTDACATRAGSAPGQVKGGSSKHPLSSSCLRTVSGSEPTPLQNTGLPCTCSCRGPRPQPAAARAQVRRRGGAQQVRPPGLASVSSSRQGAPVIATSLGPMPLHRVEAPCGRTRGQRLGHHPTHSSRACY